MMTIIWCFVAGLIIGLAIKVIQKSVYMPEPMWIQVITLFGKPYAYIENIESKRLYSGPTIPGRNKWDLIDDPNGSKGWNLHFFLWPFFKVYNFKISYTRKVKSGEQKEGDIILKKIMDTETKEVIELLVLRTRTTNHLLFRENYPMLTPSLSTDELANINVMTDPVLEILNPEKALFNISDWLKTSISILNAGLRGFVATKNLHDLNKLSSEGASGTFNTEMKSLVNKKDDDHPGLHNIGITLFKYVFEDFDPADEESKKLMDSFANVTIADEEAKASVKKAEGEANVKKTLADGNAYATEKERGAIIAMDKKQLIETGHAKVDTNGNIIKLVPDANTQVMAEALKKTGIQTLVLDSDGITKIVNLNK